MSRLNRAEAQRRNRNKVLAAARAEFLQQGFRDAKIDAIAERAELTRGAVYSNFPGKRALYFAVLAEDAERTPVPGEQPAVVDARAALGALARAWVGRLPLATDEPHTTTRLGRDLIPEIVADDRVRRPYAQLMKLSAVMLGLGLERLPAKLGRPGRTTRHGERRVRLAEMALTTLHGASQLAAAAPGFVDEFDVISACERLAGIELDDAWGPPHLAHIPHARPADEPWSPPPAVDAVRGRAADLAGDGVIAVLGLHRLAAVEEAVRAAPAGCAVTAVLVTGVPDEFGPLVRLVLAELRTWLAHAFPPAAYPPLGLVHDGAGGIAAAAGVPAVSDATEYAVRVRDGRIVARADGFGACHAVAAAGDE